MVKVFDKYGPVAIFIFALTPLPDDLLFIPLGIMRYSFVKAFIPAIIGKTLMTFIVAYSGQQSIEFITVIFGESGLLGTAITAVVLALVIYSMIKSNWEKMFEKHVESKT